MMYIRKSVPMLGVLMGNSLHLLEVYQAIECNRVKEFIHTGLAASIAFLKSGMDVIDQCSCDYI